MKITGSRTELVELPADAYAEDAPDPRGHFRGVPLAGVAHLAAIRARSRLVVIEGFFTSRICFPRV